MPFHSLCTPLHFLWTKSTHRRRSRMTRRTGARSATWHHSSLSAGTKLPGPGQWPSLRPKSPSGYRQSTGRWAWSWLWCWKADCTDTCPPRARCRSRCWHFPSIEHAQKCCTISPRIEIKETSPPSHSPPEKDDTLSPCSLTLMYYNWLNELSDGNL